VGGVGLLGGAFDPPHLGHVALARGAKEWLAIDRLVVLVATSPGHKHVATPASVRFELARAAFPDDEVRLDDHARTVELLREHEWDDPVVVIGADQLRDFPTWQEPDEVLRLGRLGVGARPGYSRAELESVIERLARPDRVELFEVEPHDVASSDVRRRVAAGEPLEGVVPPAVERLILEGQVYRP
jgi:nicotinate-nucleotide adenylyltransferase